jgi:hypothetical protein
MATFALSAHALLAARERGIEPSWIERALLSPTTTMPDRRDRDLVNALRAIPEREGRVLRVVYDPTVTPWRVVTVFFDRRERRRG